MVKGFQNRIKTLRNFVWPSIVLISRIATHSSSRFGSAIYRYDKLTMTVTIIVLLSIGGAQSIVLIPDNEFVLRMLCRGPQHTKGFSKQNEAKDTSP